MVVWGTVLLVAQGARLQAREPMWRSVTLRASATSGVTLAMGDVLCQWHATRD